MDVYKDHFFVEMYTEHEGHLHGFKNVVVAKKTAFQQIEIVDTCQYGRCMLLDGMMQSSQADEFIYHEFLTHPALVTHPDPKKILIIGGGEGATLREVIKHPNVTEVDMVEIDGEVLDFAKEHLEEWHGHSFDDNRVTLIVDDGRAYLKKQTKKYDVVIIDISDPGSEGPAYLLYTKQFYELVKSRLNSNGLIVCQAGTSSIVQGNIMSSIYKTLRLVFKVVRPYEACIPSFDLPWGFCIAANHLDPKELTQEDAKRRLDNRSLNTLKAYDSETHIGLFHITKALKDALEQQGRPIEDERPVYTPL